MFKTIVSYILIVFGLAALGISTSQKAMIYIWEKRDGHKWWSTYDWMNGDLVSMAHLDIVKKFVEPHHKPVIKHPVYTGARTTELYLHGDSYSRHLSDSAFAGLVRLHLIDRNHGYNYHLDATKNNILLIEITERYLRDYFGGLQILDEVCDSLIKKKSISSVLCAPRTGIHIASLFSGFSVDDLFNKYINQNLQCNLFNYNFMMPMFGAKAAINYYIFNRADGDVVISDDRDRLFLKGTVSKTGTSSSYSPVSDEEVNRLADNFNTIYDHYKGNGFKEVYLSIIPNPATILQPGGYNNLIPRIHSHPKLRMKIIDAYTAFKKSSQILYLPGDTHWNDNGRQLWLDLVNEKLLQ